MTEWTQDERRKLVLLVKTQLSECGGVDFGVVGEALEKTPKSCESTYLSFVQNQWTQEMDDRLRAFCADSQEPQPYWPLVGYRMGLYDVACRQRFYFLGLDKDAAWTDAEIVALKAFWGECKARLAEQKEKVLYKRDFRERLPGKSIWQIRAQLVRMGEQIMRVWWK